MFKKRSFMLILTAIVFCVVMGNCKVYPSVHLQVARSIGNDSPWGLRECPAWSEIKGVCYSDSQSFYPGSSDNPTQIDIITWEVGRLQLNHAVISDSWGLNWTSSEGESVDPASMKEGTFYTFRRVKPKAGFLLVIP
jgi:hypothetical protein